MSKLRFLFVVCTAAFAGAGAALHAEAWSNPDFSFKFEKAPEPGEVRKITIKIVTPPKPEKKEPVKEASRPDDPAKASTPTKPANTTSYAWFWDQVPPGMDTDGPIRLHLAWARLKDKSNGNTLKSPRLQVLQTIAEEHGRTILGETIGTKVSPALVLAVIAVESAGKTDAVSHAGAQGLMQLMPPTAKRFGVTDSLSAPDNIKGGVAYLDWLLREFNGDAMLALAGYNAGEGAVKKHGGVPPYEETRGYVPKVLAAFQVAKNLCMTQPELITDACALNVAMK